MVALTDPAQSKAFLLQNLENSLRALDKMLQDVEHVEVAKVEDTEAVALTWEELEQARQNLLERRRMLLQVKANFENPVLHH